MAGPHLGWIASAARSHGSQSRDKATYDSLAAAAEKVKGEDLKALREQFKALSFAVAKLVEKQAVAGHGIYFCPMADAYWIQKSGAVKNPYYGAKMLGCGEVVKKVQA